MLTSGTTSSATCEWATPRALFDELNEEFGFDLDVCSTHKNAKCKCHYTKEEDGLAQKWEGTVWRNPPYGREIGAWMQKCATANSKGVTVALVPAALVPAGSKIGYFHMPQNCGFFEDDLSLTMGRMAHLFQVLL